MTIIYTITPDTKSLEELGSELDKISLKNLIRCLDDKFSVPLGIFKNDERYIIPSYIMDSDPEDIFQVVECDCNNSYILIGNSNYDNFELFEFVKVTNVIDLNYLITFIDENGNEIKVFIVFSGVDLEEYCLKLDNSILPRGIKTKSGRPIYKEITFLNLVIDL